LVTAEYFSTCVWYISQFRFVNFSFNEAILFELFWNDL